MTYVLCPDGARGKILRGRDDVLLLCGPDLGAERSVQRYDSVLLEVLGFCGEVDMVVETIANHGNADSQQGSQRKNGRRFHHVHDDRMLLSSL
jgi:hypothetical protein